MSTKIIVDDSGITITSSEGTTSQAPKDSRDARTIYNSLADFIAESCSGDEYKWLLDKNISVIIQKNDADFPNESAVLIKD
jgi:hypothetical protein